MAHTVRHAESSVAGSEAHVPDETARDDISTADHDEEKRDEEKEVEAVSSPVTGGAGVIALSRDHTDDAAPANNTEDDRVTPAVQSTETSEKADKNDVEASKGDTEEEDEEANIVFPSGVPLALLTFGLCMAT